jgi:ferrous iron transport protein B
MIAPLMSCSARLPVYVLMIGLFVPDTNLAAGWLPAPLSIPLRAVVLLGISSLGLVVALPVAILLRKTILRGEPSAFLLELPDYRIPSLSVTLFRVRESAMAFVKQAGTLILATSVLVWFAGSWPGNHTERYALMTEIEQLETSTAAGSEAPADGAADSTASRIETLSTRLNQLNSDILENSLLGRAGHLIEPLVSPLGWDWRIGVGVIASFPAREVIVATMGTIFRMGADVDEEHEGLRGALRSASRPDGSPLMNLPAAASIMVFFALCAQCVSTLVVIRNETHSWRWPIFSFVYMTTLAWVGAFITWQIGVRL